MGIVIACICILFQVTGFFSVAYLTSFVPFDSVYFSSVSDFCVYPSYRLCLPWLTSFPVIDYLFIFNIRIIFYKSDFLYFNKENLNGLTTPKKAKFPT